MKAEVVCDELPDRDIPALLDFVEEPLNQVAGAV
jgi:hypothetical protein